MLNNILQTILHMSSKGPTDLKQNVKQEKTFRLSFSCGFIVVWCVVLRVLAYKRIEEFQPIITHQQN